MSLQTANSLQKKSRLYPLLCHLLPKAISAQKPNFRSLFALFLHLFPHRNQLTLHQVLQRFQWLHPKPHEEIHERPFSFATHFTSNFAFDFTSDDMTKPFSLQKKCTTNFNNQLQYRLSKCSEPFNCQSIHLKGLSFRSISYRVKGPAHRKLSEWEQRPICSTSLLGFGSANQIIIITLQNFQISPPYFHYYLAPIHANKPLTSQLL